MVSSGQSSSLSQALATGPAPPEDGRAPAEAGFASAMGGGATRIGATRIGSSGTRAAGVPARGNGSSPWPALADADPEAAPTTPTTSKRPASRTPVTRAGRPSLRRQHLPFAVLAHEGDLTGVALVALLAQDLQGRRVALGRRALDLELRPLHFLLHLFDAALRVANAHLRREHALVHEGVAVDDLLDGAVGERLAPTLEGLLGRRELRARRRQLKRDAANLLLGQLDGLAVGLD